MIERKLFRVVLIIISVAFFIFTTGWLSDLLLVTVTSFNGQFTMLLMVVMSTWAASIGVYRALVWLYGSTIGFDLSTDAGWKEWEEKWAKRKPFQEHKNVLPDR